MVTDFRRIIHSLQRSPNGLSADWVYEIRRYLCKWLEDESAIPKTGMRNRETGLI